MAARKGIGSSPSKCDVCGQAMVVRKASTERPYRYDLSGLDNVYLVGIEVGQCSGCDVQVPMIPKIEALHKEIAKYLVFKKDPLNGKEIKFLRKNAGIDQKQFAALIEIDASHLSRVENGKTDALGGATDKLARAVAMAANHGEDLRKILMDLANRKLREKKAVFALSKDRWEKMAA